MAQRCLCPRGMAGGFACCLRKLYWPCWLVQRSSGGCPGPPPAAGELIYHLPLQVHTMVSEPSCSSVPCSSPATFPAFPGKRGEHPADLSWCATATEWRPLLSSLAHPWAGPSWDPAQKAPRAPDSDVANPVLQLPTVPTQGKINTFGVQKCWLVESLTWGKGDQTRGFAGSSVSNSCAHLHALARESQGLPQNPQAHAGMHTSTLQAGSEIFTRHPHTQICPQQPSPQQEVVTWTICWDMGHKVPTCAGVPRGWAL